MKKVFLKFVAMLTLAASLGTMIPFAVSAAEYDHSNEFNIDGFDCKTENGNIFIYPNNSDKVRYVKGNDYKENNFRYAKLMIFNADGKLIEAGGDIYANSETVTGSPQQGVYVPAGGFLVAFFPNPVPQLNKCFTTAMENAMLYNATMAIIYDVHGSVNGNKLTIEYNDPAPVSADAKRFLFVGNSSTYFSGTPIIFKGLAQAAGVEIDVDYSTFGSAFLSEFSDENHERGRFLRNKLANNSYDYVVLQDAASTSYHITKPHVEKLLPLIEDNGAEALLYMRYSAASTVDRIRENAKKHHTNYATIAKDFDLVCAPSADAFVYCAERYPEINLYADDGGHHSKAGAYLAACTWLYSYLGVDPTGNGYDAQLGEDTAKKLWECAKIACEEGYPFEEEDTSFTDKDGVKYENIAKGKTYTATGGAYTNESWTDTKDGKPMGKLTDGFIAKTGDEGAIGAYLGKSHVVTIDLGSVSSIINITTDIFGNSGWGIPDPKDMKISVSISNDGKSFTDVGEAVSSDELLGGAWTKRNFTLLLPSLVEARYIRLTYKEQNFIWSSEILVHGILGEEDSDTDAETSVIESENADESDTSIAEPENKKLAWLYWLIGGIVLVGGIAAAIIISKKK